MEPRLNLKEVAPEALRALHALDQYVTSSGFEPSLLDLVRLRASQINKCAYCIDAHTKDARARGETEQRIYALDAWRDTPFYTERERAALAWTEAVTLINESHVPDELYQSVRQQFSAKELVDLTVEVIYINGWTRLGISFRPVPGTYQPHKTVPVLEHA